MSKNKECIGVVFGGASGEHNVSIKSAQTVIKALTNGINSHQFQIVCIYIDKQGRWWGKEVAQKALNKGTELKGYELPLINSPQGFNGLPDNNEEIDIWYPVLHGPNGEDGSIQGLFQLIGKPFVGSGVLGSAIGMDKIAMKAAFAAAGLPQAVYESAQSIEIQDSNSLKLLIKRLQEKIGYPCFIKPANLGSSVGISKVYNRNELIKGLQLASNFDDRILVEKNVNGRELECAVLGKKEMKTSLVGEIQHKSDWYDYETKYSSINTKTLIPAPISKAVSDKIRELSLTVCKAISAEGFARVDFFYDEVKDEILVNEINTLPGFTMQSMYPMLWGATGIKLEQLVAEIVKTSKE